MQIRFFINLAGPAHGGLQVLVLRLAQHLKKLGHDARIIARFMETYPPDYQIQVETPKIAAIDGVEVEIIAARGWRLWLLYPVLGLIKHRKTFFLGRALYQAAFRSVINQAVKGADLVHYVGTGWELLGYAAMASARRHKIPFIVEPALHVGQRGDGPADWFLYKMADLVIAHTQFEADALHQRGVKASHLHVVPHGFDAQKPGDGAKFRSSHGIEGPMILFIGRRCDDKGYFMLLEAFAHLLKHVPDAILVIAGPGDLSPSTAANVIELGRISDEIKQDALSACTIFCMPSKGESFGMAYFEAWNCGKPVVALDLPVLHETVGASGGGLLAAKDNVEDLVEKLLLLLEHPQQAIAMGARGREFAERYSWNQATQSCLEAYSQALKNYADRFAD